MLTPSSHRSRNHSHGETVLDAIHTIAQLAKDATEIANVPFASQGASLLTSLVEIAKQVKDNDDARDRLITSATTYSARLQPFLDNLYNDDPEALKRELSIFTTSLQGIANEVSKRKSLLRRIFSKGSIATKLVDQEKAMQTSCNALLISIASNTLKVVQKIDGNSSKVDVDIPRYNTWDVIPKGRIRDGHGFFADAESAEARGQRVIIKKVKSAAERDQEARKWSRILHSNLPHIAGYSNDNSGVQFLLFHDYWFDTCTSKRTAQIGSVAALLLGKTRTDDAFSIVSTLVDFMNDAISAFRHMQEQLNLSEDQTAFLATITRYTLSSDGRIIVTPPLQTIARDGSSVANRVFWSLIPSDGAGEGSMRRYLATLDGAPSHASVADVLDGEQLEKWSLVDSLRTQNRILPDGIEKPRQYVMPETRWAKVDYSVDVKPGDFGIFVPGEVLEYAFQRVASPFGALFSRQSWQWLYDRNEVVFDVVRDVPLTWKLDRLTDGCVFSHQHYQRLTNTVHRTKRFLELSAPEDSGVDELVFIVSYLRCHNYQYTLCSGLLEERQMDDVFAELQDPDNDKLRFSNCDPSVCPSHCLPYSQIRIENYHDYMCVEYVTVPVRKDSANLESEKKQYSQPFRHKECELIIQSSQPVYKECNPPWNEWP